MKLCLLRGLIIAVKTAFMSDSDDGSISLHPAHRDNIQFTSSFEHFLYEWNVLVLFRLIPEWCTGVNFECGFLE